MRRLTLALVLGAVSVAPASAAAQSCLGFPSFADGPVRISAGASFPKDASAYVGGLAAGVHGGAFVGGGYARVKAKEFDQASNQGYLDAGIQIPAGRLQFCPVLGALYSTGPNTAPDEKNTAWFGAAGLAVGIPFGSAALSVVPNVSVKWEYAQYKQSYDDAALDAKLTEQSGVIDAGLGFIIGRRLSLQPTVQIPFATKEDENTDPVFGVLLSLSFGRRR